MSGQGAPQSVLHQIDAQGVSVAVVASRWHTAIMDGLLDGAQRALQDASVHQSVIVRVPGSFELPVAAARLAAHYDAVVTLGVVIRGGTPHFDYVCQAATDGITKVAVDTATPVGFGVLTCDTEQQGLDRAGLPDSTEDKGYEATAAAIETAVTLRDLGV
ncbi:MAG: 6,7-dimethyl-8-ribityllumazine synthase [Kocuria sp.]|nr:6,7-dimethyl-8-ribityllumazine synthase [Kocuria sp.]